ncbi:ac5f7ab3-7ca5-4c5e-bc32-3a1189cdcc9c [Thermothielavioides terrestris]|uniref:Ac5f7ab3-7ca5-4c5e-bc32-3a1189cdcc9c n=1 Tax=Thermothielavioides terrestris TaxID=2587410 RepID=A0A3S4BA75_9PEZI|nr:ac5f7ab3-7ca5-4c5e-bc32-3a1189cdcc9c [Thermothielavioides terrestris]
MRRFLAVPAALAALGSVPGALATMQFINPPLFSGPVPASKNQVLVISSTLNIKWTDPPPDKKLSVVLYQLSASQAAAFSGSFGDADRTFEFITHDQVNATSFPWTVATNKDLSYSPLFSIAVWAEGATVTDSATGILNITRPETSTTTSASSASTSTTASASSTSSSPPTTTTSPSKSATTTPTDSAESSSPDTATAQPPSSPALSTGGAIGVGIGVAFAVVALLALGWCAGRRLAARRAAKAAEPPAAAAYYTTAGGGGGGGGGPEMYESAAGPFDGRGNYVDNNKVYYAATATRGELNADSGVYEAP